MIYKLKNEKPEDIPNFKGGEKFFRAVIHNDGLNKIIHGTLVPGATIGEHKHETDSEIIYFLSGSGYMLFDGEKERVEAGVCLTFCQGFNTLQIQFHRRAHRLPCRP